MKLTGTFLSNGELAGMLARGPTGQPLLKDEVAEELANEPHLLVLICEKTEEFENDLEITAIPITPLLDLTPLQTMQGKRIEITAHPSDHCTMILSESGTFINLTTVPNSNSR